MAISKSKALLVEDSVSYCSVLTSITSDKADWIICPDITSARESLKENKFDIIVLDLYLPDGNSIELCEKIRSDSKQHHATVVFVSGEEKLEWRLRTYEVGADDYIIKSIGAEELKVKFDALFDYQARSRSLVDTTNREINKITSALTKDSQDNTKLLSFSKQCLNISTAKQLGTVVSNFLANWNLDFCLQFKSHNNNFRLKYDGGDFSPIEDQLFLELRKNEADIQTFGHKTYIRNGSVELIVQNMPINDEHLFGSIKDLLHIALCILNNKNRHLELIFQTAQEYDLIESNIREGNLDDALTSIDKLKSLIAEDKSESVDNTCNDDIVFF